MTIHDTGFISFLNVPSPDGRELTAEDMAKAKFIFAPTFPLVCDGEFSSEIGSWNAPPIDLREALRNAKEAIRRQSLVHTWNDIEMGCPDGHVYRTCTRNLRRSRLFRGEWRVITKRVRYRENEFVWWLCRMIYNLAWEQKNEFNPCPECGKPTDRVRSVMKTFSPEGKQQTAFPWIMLTPGAKK